MLFIIISIVVVYFNAKNETSNCEPVEITTEKSEKSSMGRTPILFIAFLAITAFAVSTMNLTYKVNYFKKKTDETESGPASPSPVLDMLKKARGQQGPLAGLNYSIPNNIKNSNTENE
jgi:hypothetical protein